MTLLSGKALVPKRFFTSGSPQAQSSSFDLTVGKIYDSGGKELEGPFTLRPGHMVQIVSAEVFKLGNDVTGHVTYKTGLTRIGIWALTVGIVDPGWEGPIGTTLLNFSRSDYAILIGDPFLRVSFFEHAPVAGKLRAAPKLDDYYKEMQRHAATKFPTTFLNSDELAKLAGASVLKRIRIEGLAWVGLIALIFVIVQLVANYFSPSNSNSTMQVVVRNEELDQIKIELKTMKNLLDQIQSANSIP